MEHWKSTLMLWIAVPPFYVKKKDTAAYEVVVPFSFILMYMLLFKWALWLDCCKFYKGLASLLVSGAMLQVIALVWI